MEKQLMSTVYVCVYICLPHFECTAVWVFISLYLCAFVYCIYFCIQIVCVFIYTYKILSQTKLFCIRAFEKAKRECVSVFV